MKKAIASLIAVILIVSGFSVFAFAEGEPTDEEIRAAKTAYEAAEAEANNAQVVLVQKQQNLQNAQAALAAAQEDLNKAGHDFINEKAGSGFSVEDFTSAYTQNTTISEYVNDTYNAELASALSIENLNAAADLITECNELRANDSLNPLKMNYRLMVFAATSAAVSSQVSAHTVFNEYKNDAVGAPVSQLGGYMAENISWSLAPFNGWYTQEKQTYEAAVAEHPEIENMSAYDLYVQYPSVYMNTGHYLNIIGPEYSYTGFRRPNSPKLTDVQCFSSYAQGGESVTPTEFKNALSAYAAPRQTAVDSASNAANTATSEFAQAQNDLNEKEAAVDAAYEAYRELASLPAPTGLKWRDDMPHMAVWNATSSPNIQSYEVRAKVVKANGNEYLSDPKRTENYNGACDFDDFFEEHGSGEYSFTVRAIAYPYSERLDSDPAESGATAYKALRSKVVVLDEDGNEDGEDGSQGMLEIYDDDFDGILEGGQIGTYDYIVYPAGTKIEISAITDIGYMFKEIDFDNDPGDLVRSGKTARFTLDSDYEVTVKIQEDSRTVPVKIDFGAAHEELAGKVLEAINDDGEYEASLTGSILTLDFPFAATLEDVKNYVKDHISDELPSFYEPSDNGEMWYNTVGRKKITEYADEDEIREEDESAHMLDMPETLSLYVLWAKKVTNASFTIETPICGKEVATIPFEQGLVPYSIYTQTVIPLVAANEDSELLVDTAQGMIPTSSWYKEYNAELVRPDAADNWFEGTIEGGSEYFAGFPVAVKFGYYLDPGDLPEITINGTKIDNETGFCHAMGITAIMGKVTAEHDWNDGDLIEEPTCTGQGLKKYTCKADENHTRTEEVAALGHNMEFVPEVPAKCEEGGTKAHYKCDRCEKLFEDEDGIEEEAAEDLIIKAKGHAYGDAEYKWSDDNKTVTATRICGNDPAHKEEETAQVTIEVTKEATVDEGGEQVLTATFTNAAFETQTKTVAIPKLTPDPVDPQPEPVDPQPDPEPQPTPDPVDPKKQYGEDGTPTGKGASYEAAEAAITGMKKDEDPAGSKVAPLFVISTKQTKTSVTLTWKKPAGAKKFVIFGNQCGKTKKIKKLMTTTKKKITIKKAVKKIAKGKYYKFVVVSLDKNNKVVSTSKMVHVATKGGKVGNFKKVTTKAKKNKVTLKVGKTFKLAAKGIPASKKLKVKTHGKMRYESANALVATVTGKGVIKGKKKGTTYVYAYTQNGAYAKVKVTVK